MAEQTPSIVPSPYGAESLTVIKYRKRSLEMYPMLDSELRELISGYSSVHLAFFGAGASAFFASLTTLLTVPLSNSLSTKFFCTVLISGAFALYSGVMAAKDWLKSRNIVRQMRKETGDIVVQDEK